MLLQLEKVGSKWSKGINIYIYIEREREKDECHTSLALYLYSSLSLPLSFSPTICLLSATETLPNSFGEQLGQRLALKNFEKGKASGVGIPN